MSALLVLTAACGSDDEDATASDDRDEATVTTPAVGDDGAGDEGTEDQADGEGDAADGGSGDGGGDGAATDEDEAEGMLDTDTSTLCQDLALEDVVAASGIEVVEAEEVFGGATVQDLEYQTEGCSFAVAEGDGEVTVKEVLDPEGGAEAFFAALADVSATSTMDDFPHQEVEGLGDGAFFKAGLRSGDLVVLHGGGILIVEGETPAGEQLGQAEMQAVAEAALATLG